jgi:hypothetical protein
MVILLAGATSTKLMLPIKLMKVAEELIGEDPDWACGAGLLSLYLEAQTFPTDDAREMALRIEDWYRTAIETEFCRLP